MFMFYRTRIFRFVAATLTLSMLVETITPTVALALTDGPSQAEFTGSSGSGSLVSPFTGAFSYSIPVLNVPGPGGMGYSLSLSYDNNTSPESEASWVGLGWSLNAGAINRIKRGYPDDYNGSSVKYWRSMRPNSTIRVGVRGGLEVLSDEGISLGVDAAFTLQYNNYSGYDHFFDLGASAMGVSGSMNFSENGVELDGDFQPLALIGELVPGWFGVERKEFSWRKLGVNFLSQLMAAQPGLKYLTGGNEFHAPSRSTPYKGFSLSLAGAVEGDILPNMGLEGGINGSWTKITNIPQYSESAYGYLYSNNASGESAGMDYYLENEGAYNDRDRRLPMPFSNADYFAMSGSGMGGTFRAHHRAQGFYRPAKTEGSIDVGHLNLDIHLGGGIGVGAAVGGGRTKSSTKGWNNNGLSFTNDSKDGEPAFFRFRGDQGGSILDANNDAVQMDPSGSGWKDGATVWTSVNNGERVGRSVYVGYNTNSTVLDRPTLGCFGAGHNRFRSFSRRNSVIDSYVNRSSSSVSHGIGEFSVVNSSGMTYVYGLPVYSRDEINMSYSVRGLATTNIHNNFLAYKYVAPYEYANNDNLSGMEAPAPYATNFLLTEIVSPDYVDRTENGPTQDDLGGYVIFNYKRVAGSPDKADANKSAWYRWRSPYNGTFYGRNSYSDPYDDAGSFSSGFKEIYYLESIETKTHKAVFHTSKRQDGYEASQDESVAAANASPPAPPSGGNPKLHKLEKVKLWSKDANGNPDKLLTTTYFEYDYSLCKGLPNSESNGGKLTLKRMWFEYEGVVGARISPYEFGYEYKNSSYFTGKGDISTRYGDIIEYGDDLSSTGPNNDQNPDYSSFDIDVWGNYQRDGDQRYLQNKPGVNQTPDVLNFDPAAWQLKWIKLPSGSEIHVQYEQHDYRYVQDREVMALVPLKGRKSTTVGNANWHTYELDLADLGITTPTDKQALADKLAKHFGDKDGGFAKDREYIYFRFLYGLIDNNALAEGPEPDPDFCNTEYISGYAAVTGVEYDAGSGKVFVKIGDAGQAKTIPDKKCKEFYKGARDGIVEMNCGRAPDAAIQEKSGSNEDAASSATYSLLQSGMTTINTSASYTLCQDINYSHSYLRIPMIKDKKGGGIRVKRILNYDPGLENEDVALYGQEYIYKTEDGRSSGVAANEPANNREENPVVRLGVPARGVADSIVSGKAVQQLEEPLGESLMPGAAIGYSRVITRNIHTGKSGMGFAVREFYTARDYPFDLRNAKLPNQQAASHGTRATALSTDRSEPFPIDVVVFGTSSIYVNATQGFRFVINSMHGQTKSIAKYVGGFDPDNPHLDDATMVEQSAYEYFQPWETIPIMNGPSLDDITQAYPGKVMEVVTESREMTDDASDVNLQVDFEAYLGFLFPLPFGSASGRYQVNKTVLRTHATTKVIEYPAIVKSITTTQDGIVDRTDYAGFDPESGAPLLVKKYDEFHGLTLNGSPTPHNGTYYSVGIPAWQHYPQFGQKARTQNLILKSDVPANSSDGNSGLAFDKRFIRTANGDEHYLIVRTVKPGASSKLVNALTTGDLIEITFDGSPVGAGVYSVGTVAANRIELLPTSYSFSNNYQLVSNVQIEIVRSARSNRVNTTIGGFTTYGKVPLKTEHPIP